MSRPLATWLRETRLRQRTPEGRPWSQEFLVDRVNEWAAETGWTLYRPNYVSWESGKRDPQPETVARLVAFWQSRGEPEPDLTPKAEPLSLDERAVLAAEAQVEATRAQTEVYRAMVEQFQRQADAAEARADLLERLVIGLLAPAARATADPQALRVLEEWGQAALASMLSPQPEGDPASGSGGR